MSRLTLGVLLLFAASAALLLTDHLHRAARAADDGQIKRVALVRHASQPILEDGARGIRRGLAAGGWLQGRNLDLIEFNAEGDMGTANAIAREVASGKFDLIITITTPSLQTVATANRDGRTPHVFGLVTDPVAAGVGITQLAPGGNPAHLTGIGTKQPVPEAFALLRQLRPGLTRVGVPWNPTEANSEANVKMARRVCADLGLELLEANVENSSGVAEAVASLAGRGAQAIWVGGDVTVLTAVDAAIGVAQRNRIPVFSVIPPNVERGALFDLGADYEQVGFLTGELAARVLSGESPGDLPVSNILPQQLLLNPAALRGLRESWSFPDSVREQATVILGERDSRNTSLLPPPPPGRTFRINIISYVDTAAVEDAIHGIQRGFAEAGWTDAIHLHIQAAQGDLGVLNSMVDASVAARVDLIMPITTPALQACLNKVSRQPIVFCVVADAQAAGALNPDGSPRPNLTGSTVMSPFVEMVQLIRQHFPAWRRIGTLFTPGEINSVTYQKIFTQVARDAGLELISVPANTPSEVPDAAAALAGMRLDAIIQISDSLTSTTFSSIAQAAQRAKLPLFTFNSPQSDQGAWLTYARDFEQSGADAAALAIRVLSGTPPASLPIQPVSKLTLTLNPELAAKHGITFPPEIHALATAPRTPPTPSPR
ncbi:MAG: ABC transporter substrate-binding protein [Verrucomicrobiia bacterium]